MGVQCNRHKSVREASLSAKKRFFSKRAGVQEDVIMRFVRNKICSSGVSSSTKSEVSCFRNTIPPKGWEAVVEMPEVPHQGIPCTTGVFSEKRANSNPRLTEVYRKPPATNGYVWTYRCRKDRKTGKPCFIEQGSGVQYRHSPLLCKV